MADSSSLTAPSSMESVKLRFRLHDGTDVGPVDMPLTATVGEVKEAVLAAWPPEKTSAPEGVSGLKLILSGRLLADNGVTLAEARCPTDGLVTMHLVMAPPKARRAKKGHQPSSLFSARHSPRSDPTNYHLMLQPKKVAVESPASGDGSGPCCCTVQ